MQHLDVGKEVKLLKYLLEQIEAIEVYTRHFDQDLFLRNDMVKDASLMKLIVFGEFSARLDDRLKTRFTEVQWQLIKAARNYYVHAYNGVDWTHVWEVIAGNIPTLKPRIEHIIEVLEKENNAKIN